MMQVLVVRLFTKIEVRRLFRSEDIAYLLCDSVSIIQPDDLDL